MVVSFIGRIYQHLQQVPQWVGIMKESLKIFIQLNL
jgi:hypothetical protein